MKLLHNIGLSPSSDPRVSSNYNTREEILACQEPLSFDGIYLNVWENRDVLIGKDVTLFVMGDYVGGNNAFDAGMPLEPYCDWWHLLDLVANYGCKLGWHTWTHPDLTKATDDLLESELMVPIPMNAFAFPHGRYDSRVIEAVKRAGFTEAWSVTQGDGSRFAKVRTYLNK